LPRLLACAAILTELNRRLRSRSTTRPNCSYPTDQPPPRFFIPGPFDLSVRARSGTRLDQRATGRSSRRPPPRDRGRVSPLASCTQSTSNCIRSPACPPWPSGLEPHHHAGTHACSAACRLVGGDPPPVTPPSPFLI
jgi:hypothetical protein